MASTNIGQSDLVQLLADLPDSLAQNLCKHYLNAKRLAAAGDFEHAGLAVGKFCEVAVRVVQVRLGQTATPLSRSLGNLHEECEKIRRLPKTAGPEGLRIIATRAIEFAYTMRNKRGIGHASGLVEASELDLKAIVRAADWVMAEVVAAGPDVAAEDAQNLVRTLSVREIPAVWSTGGKKRILRANLPRTAQALLLLANAPDENVPVEDLCEWIEHPKLGLFVRDVVRPLHQKRLVEFDEESRVVTLSPTGAAEVENNILPLLTK